MEFENVVKKDRIYRKFILLLFFMLGITTISTLGLLFITKGQNQYIYKITFLVTIIILISISLLLLAIIFTAVTLWYGYPAPKNSKRLLEMSLTIIYPAMVFCGKVLKYNKNTIRRAFTELNNKLVFSNEYNIEGKNILVLTPHCIQKTFCPHKITTDIRNCKLCGGCNVHKLIELEEKYGVNFRVVTGGTLARKIIIDIKPKAIIAIACERDLISGLQDVKSLPIIAILNSRPEGPCVNTSVDVEQVEKAIQHFLYSKTSI